jgi:hypothetical protein
MRFKAWTITALFGMGGMSQLGACACPVLPDLQTDLQAASLATGIAASVADILGQANSGAISQEDAGEQLIGTVLDQLQQAESPEVVAATVDLIGQLSGTPVSVTTEEADVLLRVINEIDGQSTETGNVEDDFQQLITNNPELLDPNADAETISQALQNADPPVTISASDIDTLRGLLGGLEGT